MISLCVTGTARREESREVRATLELRERQLIALVRELHSLASSEKESGKVSHTCRSKLFSQCATIFESLGSKAFEDEGAGAGGELAQ